MLLQNTLLLALIYRYTNTSWLRAAGVLGGSVAAIASVLTGAVCAPEPWAEPRPKNTHLC
jgi:hypothetical protein